MTDRTEFARLARHIAAGDNAAVPSPCVSVCRMDPASGLCEGCCRTIGEIAAWSGLDDDGKRAVWASIAERVSAPSPRGAAAGDDRSSP